MRTSRAAQLMVGATTAALGLSLGVSVVTYLAGLTISFSAEGTAEQKAALMATGILTMMNVKVFGFTFLVVFGALLSRQYSRRSKLARSR